MLMAKIIYLVFSQDNGISIELYNAMMEMIDGLYGGTVKQKINNLIEATDGQWYFPSEINEADIAAIIKQYLPKKKSANRDSATSFPDQVL